MTKDLETNSIEYWNQRFSTHDWHEHGGEKQSAFFMQVLIANLPSWFRKLVSLNSLSIADWGCACGDGTAQLKGLISPNSTLLGIDFSQSAISDAQTKYPDIKFKCEDWLIIDEDVTDIQKYDLVISSNTLEHFDKPLQILEKLSRHAKHAIVLLLPFRENEPDPEHMVTFDEMNLPYKVGNKFRLAFTSVINCASKPETLWAGDQILLIYGTDELIAENVSTLKDTQPLYADICDLSTRLKANSQMAESLRAHLDRLVLDLQQTKNSLISLRSGLGPLADETNLCFRIISLFVNRQFTKKIKKRVPDRVKYIFNCARRLINPPRPKVVPKNKSQALNFQSFYDHIGPNLSNYKGVFIQEICIDWFVPLFQRPQQMSLAMAKAGYLVIYKTPNLVDNIKGFVEAESNVWVTDDLSFSLANLPTSKPIIRSYYSTSYALSEYTSFDRSPNEYAIYEYIDHIDPEISGHDSSFIALLNDQKERAFNGAVDAIVASSRVLADEAISHSKAPRVAYIPNGVNVSHYRNIDKISSKNLPGDLGLFLSRHNKVVGYFGAIAPWLWYDVLNKLVTLRPDIGFVFIGPDYYNCTQFLPITSNFHYAGTVDYKALPSYAEHFDVCLIPFKPGEIAKTTSPLKLFEYFALEKPVVVTSAMLECIQYDEVLHGNNYLELSDAIDLAFTKKDDLEFKAKMARLADENDWKVRAHQIVKLFSHEIENM